jgi:Flp pilus assembly pilin Flp
MRNLFAKLWNDDRGNVAFEYLALVTIVGLGLIVGFSNIRNALVEEYTELASAVTNLSQEYSYRGIAGCGANVDGGATNDDDNTYTAATTTPNVTDVSIDLCP